MAAIGVGQRGIVEPVQEADARQQSQCACLRRDAPCIPRVDRRLPDDG